MKRLPPQATAATLAVTEVAFTGRVVEQQQRALQGQIEMLQMEVDTLKGNDG